MKDIQENSDTSHLAKQLKSVKGDICVLNDLLMIDARRIILPEVIGKHLQEDPLNEYFDHKDSTLRNCVYKLISKFDKTHVSPQGVLDKIDNYVRGANETLAETRMAIHSLLNKTSHTCLPVTLKRTRNAYPD